MFVRAKVYHPTRLQGGILTGAVVLLSLAFLMPYCAFIPRTTLASVIICAVIFSIEYHVVIPIWKSKSMRTLALRLSKSQIRSIRH
jgi:sodium-independent sulfate anion transporter 11